MTKAVRTRLPAEVLKLWPPRGSRAALSEMRVFAGCDRSQLARITRSGDVVEVSAGEVLVREDYTDYWFFVILEGSAKVLHRGREVAKLHRGQHFGEIAIVGFRPQPATVTAAESTVLFVLGRQHLLSLVSRDLSIQRALFPEVDPGGFTKFRRELQEEGRRSWDRLVPTQRRELDDRFVRTDTAGQVVRTAMPRPPGRTLSWDEALEQLSRLDRRPTRAPLIEPQPAPKRVKLIAVALISAVLGGIAFLFHPPLAVVTAGQPIDVVQDISIAGAAVGKPTGRYLMTLVNVDRPNVARFIYAWGARRTIVPVESSGRDEIDLESERRHGRDAFRRSHRLAVELAERELGVDAKGITIAIRDRGVIGPSAGLIYALAIVDMLDADDLAADRTIAATGELRQDASVGRVGFVRLKADAAREDGARLFLVPASQRDEVQKRGLRVLGVATLKAAVRALDDTRQSAD